MKKSFQFKIQIKGITKPPVWRRVVVPDSITFDQFHKVIQAVFNWDDTNLYRFFSTGANSCHILSFPHGNDANKVEDFRKIKLGKIFLAEKQTFSYVYDLGNYWHHVITLERISTDDLQEKVTYIDGKGACPPDNCGGVWSYNYFKEIMRCPENPDYEDLKEVFCKDPDEEWDVDFIDIIEIEKQMKGLNALFFIKSPQFNHKEVKIFYSTSYNINRKKLHTIVALPRQTLIEDMQKMLIDSIERFDYFNGSFDKTDNFLRHALYVLSSLHAEEALDTLFLIMNQEDDFFDYWFNTYPNEGFWQYLYWMGRNRTDKLKDFFRDPMSTFTARLTVVETITQIALRHPERKREMMEWEIDAIEYLLENIKDHDIFKPDFLEFLTCDLINIGDMSIIPLVKRCLATKHVSKRETGTLKQMKEKIKLGVVDSYYHEMFELYTEIEQYYDEWEELEEEEDLFDGDMDEFRDFLDKLLGHYFGDDDDDDNSDMEDW